MDIIQLIGFIITIIAMTIVTRKRARDARKQTRQQAKQSAETKQKQVLAVPSQPIPKVSIPRPKKTVHQPQPIQYTQSVQSVETQYVMPQAVFDEPRIIESDPSRAHELFKDKLDLRRGIILSEILGKPKALQK